jgi:hypothetical protein
MKKLDNILILIINFITKGFPKDGDYLEEII